jgi:hypothetical protein
MLIVLRVFDKAILPPGGMALLFLSIFMAA